MRFEWGLKHKVLCIFLLLFSAKKYGQEKIVDSLIYGDLNEVIVTATRTPRQLSSLPLPVTLVSKEQIKETGSNPSSQSLIVRFGVSCLSVIVLF